MDTSVQNQIVTLPKASIIYDKAISYAFQQNAIPVVKELRFCNDGKARKDIRISITTEPAFAKSVELRLEAIDANAEYRVAPMDLKLSPNFLAELNERVTGWLKCEVFEGDSCVSSETEPIALLARNEWCGLVSLPEILAAFVLPNDPAVMTILDRAAGLLRDHTGRSAFNGYQDKSHKRAWEQVAAIYKAVADLRIRYIVAPASFESSGQKVRTPSDIVAQRFANCLDLALLFCACFEQVGLHPLILMHESHAYAGCWLEERTLADAATDDLQHIRKLVVDELITVFECTTAVDEAPGTLKDAELLAQPHLHGGKPFRLALDIRRARLARIHPLPVPNQTVEKTGITAAGTITTPMVGIGDRDFIEPLVVSRAAIKPGTRIDQWKARLLDLSLRNRLLNFRETKASIRILSASPEKVEDELAADRELILKPRPKVMSEDDPRSASTYTQQQFSDALVGHLRDELKQGRLHTNLDESEHARRLTELFRSARNAVEENGTNTLFAAVGFLEWRETERSDRTFLAPLLLVPVQLKRKSVLEGFSLHRLDEETRVNVTLMEMLRQHFQKDISGLDPLPEDGSGVDVGLIFRIFREAIRDLAGWEVKTEVWLGQFSFTKFLLWKDLADRLEALTQNRVVNHLVNEAGTPYVNRAPDIRPEQLDDVFAPCDIFCPRSADSSQLAAVMAAAAGHDFVLEGPPGTGKSQTIANIISHCLAVGKRVLFVAEKRAALDVVYRRLREERLEPFCLELHSNKTGKADVLAQFDRSLKFIADSTVTDWEHRAAELKRLRDELNDYARALHHRYPCGLTPYHCLDYLLPRQNEITVRLKQWPSILETQIETLEQARQVAKLLQQRSRPVLPLAQHPLELLGCEDWSPVWAERTLNQVAELQSLVGSAIIVLNELCVWLQRPGTTMSRADLGHLLSLVNDLLAPQSVGPAFAMTPLNQLSRNLDKWIALVHERHDLRQRLDQVHAPGQTSKALKCEAWSAGEAEAVFEQCRLVEFLTKEAILAARDLHGWLAPRANATRIDIVHLVALVDSLLAPVPVGEQFALTPWGEWVAEFDRWTALVRERGELRSKLKEYDEVKLLALDLDLMNQKWLASQKAWFVPKWLHIAKIRGHLKTARPDQTKPDPRKIDEVFKAAFRLRSINADLAAATPRAEPILGPIWARGEPQLDHLTVVRTWGVAFDERLAALTGENVQWQTQLRRFVGDLLKQGPASFEIGTLIGNRLNRFRDAVTKFDSAYESLVKSAELFREPLEQAADHFSAVAAIVNLLQTTVRRLRTINAELNGAASTAKDILGVLWMDGEPDLAALARARNWGESLHNHAVACAGDNLSWLGQLRQLLASLFFEGPAAYAPDTVIGAKLQGYKETLTKLNDAFDALATEIKLRRENLDAVPDFLPVIQDFLRKIADAWPKIRDWCFWQKARSQATSLGMGPVIAKLEEEGGESQDVPALFERSFRRELFDAAVERESALRGFFGSEQNERIDRFREVDQKIADLTRELIRARLAANIPRDQGMYDIPKAEIGVLRHEIGKKMRHIPVRQLLVRMPTLLPRLKPCVLMSPLSVAQYLDPSHAIFDVVIFDEASQIPVWDAIGAIARGRQLIVVGDPKQLPPTNFFNSASDEEDSLAPEEFKDLESILDELMSNQVRHKRLQWHYRSRHEGLITFSNRQYYENDLLTFPSADITRGGIKFKYLPKARYDKGKSRTNRGEAEAVVAELVARLCDPATSRFSYGVVTFSLAQQQLVENLLDEERRKHPEIESHFGDDPPVEGEPVFVKNLENVQGDERDIILFSICYGPDENGRVAMNFGPLNRDGGERRLNVAITRAKHEVILFTCLRADQIDLTRTSARGVRDLKYFLDYAERGPSALAAATSASASGEPDSEFEKMVADELRAGGFEIHHQVGCSGYRIDLGVLDPVNPGRYLLGVECDGATYHRAATARDRDKLRQYILEGLGWTLYRIWSTDWWLNRDGEMKKLFAFINGLKGPSRAP